MLRREPSMKKDIALGIDDTLRACQRLLTALINADETIKRKRTWENVDAIQEAQRYIEYAARMMPNQKTERDATAEFERIIGECQERLLALRHVLATESNQETLECCDNYATTSYYILHKLYYGP